VWQTITGPTLPPPVYLRCRSPCWETRRAGSTITSVTAPITQVLPSSTSGARGCLFGSATIFRSFSSRSLDSFAPRKNAHLLLSLLMADEPQTKLVRPQLLPRAHHHPFLTASSRPSSETNIRASPPSSSPPISSLPSATIPLPTSLPATSLSAPSRAHRNLATPSRTFATPAV
jgi:hypothetical protein